MKVSLRGASGAALLFGLMGLPAVAQQTPAPAPAPDQAQPTQPAEATNRVVVTGSYIAGTPEDAALPVDVIDTAALAEQGSPSIVQLVKTIPSSGSSLGESNRYVGGAGTATINLRGFGAARTLVLMNGQRMADNPQAAGVDLNFIPQAALGRVEILKDGAAATYGSDAVGGVVNFITRRDVDGLEAEGEYSMIDGSDGDYLLNLAWGQQFENGNVLLAGGYRHRSRLDIHERDWAIGGFGATGGYNGAGGWTGAANPGVYVPNGLTAGTRIPTFRDNGCAELGGTLTNSVINSLTDPETGAFVNSGGATVGTPIPVNANSPQAASSTCRFQFSNFNDLVNEEEHYQFHGEVNFDLSETLQFHAEATWNRNDVIDQRLSPANLSTQFPTPTAQGGDSGSNAAPGAQNFFVPYNVPTNNPGLVDLRTQCAAPLTAAQCTAMGLVGGVDISQTTWRAIAFAGHPLNSDKADHQDVQQTEFRISGGFDGDITDDLHWTSRVTYMQGTGITSTNDLLVDRIQLALNGFGSLDTDPNSCTAAERAVPANAGNAAVGCYYFNPFTNGLQTSAVNGAANPFYRGGANPAVVNNPNLVAWLYGNYVNTVVDQLAVAELVFNGAAPIELPGGAIEWAAGAQWRYDREERIYGDFNNYQVYPCVDSINDSTPVCGAPAGPIQFFGSNANSDNDRSVAAAFGEVKLPILDNLEADFAVRYENYGGGIGGNTSPKLSLRYQILDGLAVRASASKTFRAPTSGQVNPACATGVANIGAQYRAVRTCGNPALEPEEATSYNAGFILNAGGFNATIDYFNFAFDGELTVESASRMYATLFPTGLPSLCTDPAAAPLVARFTFAGGTCAGTNVLRIDTNTVNGPHTYTSGFDVKGSYNFEDLIGLDLTIGADATYLINYKRGPFTLLGAPTIRFSEAEDRAGLYDLTAQFFSYPELRGTGYASYTMGPLTARWQVRYVAGTTPAFGTTLYQEVPDSTTASGYRLVKPGKTDDFWQNDLTATFHVGDTLTITGSVQNILDEEPPFAFSNYNYDYTSGNPLGRVFEVNVKKTF